MTSLGYAGSTVPLFVASIGLLGLILSPIAELLIDRLLPRIGGLPSTRIRMATAVITGALCAAFAWRFGFDAAVPAFILLAVLGVQLARIDVSLHLLPTPLVLSLLGGGLICLLAAIFGGTQWAGVLRAAAGGAILFVIYLILAVISPAGIGMGDVKFAAPIGLYLGYLGWSHLLYGGLLGFILNGAVTVVILRKNRSERTSEVPHGPSMLAAAAGVAIFLT
ncbi:prepilin peptidase [Pseudarthrobacter sulfonivorans]|uniref:prepilin peptidase n=1 Tax=Pseudarthrobacter sulfonivorans TaxID=121292 RepID=UPI0027802656|nr:prepilin peptidase [Pseudarthrobacter sulfonivorans]MDP9997761.1 leader peptidase (prepilin peptidase)/N-methyltransferase [Pseudarthrobacter sulfonivorans]